MKFEWDADKSAANRAKHGIDFETAKDIWLDENRVEIYAPHSVEDGGILIVFVQILFRVCLVSVAAGFSLRMHTSFKCQTKQTR